MKLSEADKHITWAIQNRADAPISDLARSLPYKEHTVRRTITKLLEKGVIWKMPVINVSALGYQVFSVYFSFSVKSAKKRNEIIDEITEDDRILIVVSLAGEYEYNFQMAVHDSIEVTNFLSSLGDKFGEVFFEKSIVIRQSFTHLGRKYLTGKNVKPTISLSGTVRDVGIDETDHRILTKLSSGKYKFGLEVARILKLPTSTVEYRIGKLKEKGIIVGFVYAISSFSLGFSDYRILVNSKSCTKDFRKRLYRSCANEDYVVNIAEMLGVWDYEIKIEVPQHGALSSVIQDFKASFCSDISSIKVLNLLELKKNQTYPFELIEERY